MTNEEMLAKLNELRAVQAERQQAADAKAALRAQLAERKSAGGERDKFGSAPASGCGKMHAALAAAYAEGMCLTTRDLIALTAYTNVPNHIGTLCRVKMLAERRATGYTLSPLGAALWHGEGKAFGFANAPQTSDVAPSGPIALESPPAPAADDKPAETKGKPRKAKAE